MEIKRIVTLRSKESALLFRVVVGKNRKRSLFNAAIHKMILLFKLSQSQQVYPTIWLLQIKQELTRVLSRFNKEAQSLESIIEKKGINPAQIVFPVREKITFGFSQPLLFQLIDVLERFDHLNNLIGLVKDVGAFDRHSSFFAFRNKCKKDFFRLLSNILKLRTRHLPQVSIDNFLEQDSVYQAACEEFGAIEPQALHNAIHLTATPYFGEKAINQISRKLEKMI